MNDQADAYIIDDLRDPDNRNWVYFTDTVMGGVSKGNLEFRQDKDVSYYRLTGFVSKVNVEIPATLIPAPTFKFCSIPTPPSTISAPLSLS